MPEAEREESSWPWASAVLAGLLAGMVLGWAVRGTLASRDLLAKAARPSPSSSRKPGTPPELLKESPREPWVIQSPNESGPQDLDSSLAGLRTVCQRFGANVRSNQRLFSEGREMARLVSVAVPSPQAGAFVKEVDRVLAGFAACGEPKDEAGGASVISVVLSSK